MARKNKQTRSEQETTSQVGGQAGGVNFAADIVRQDNVPGTLNFARELSNQQSQVPSEGDPDPNDYVDAGDDAEGFIRNPVAGGSVSVSSVLGEYVNGVDHEPAPEEDEAAPEDGADSGSASADGSEPESSDSDSSLGRGREPQSI